MRIHRSNTQIPLDCIVNVMAIIISLISKIPQRKVNVVFQCTNVVYKYNNNKGVRLHSNDGCKVG